MRFLLLLFFLRGGGSLVPLSVVRGRGWFCCTKVCVLEGSSLVLMSVGGFLFLLDYWIIFSIF